MAQWNDIRGAMRDPNNWRTVIEIDDTNKETVHFRHPFARWEEWVSIERSALIADGDEVGEDFGKGLFARRVFRYGEVVGLLSGDVVTEQEANANPSPWYVQLRNNRPGYLTNTKFGTTGYAQYINDARGTTAVNNVAIDHDGFVIVIVDVIVIGEEILTDYGQEYWA